MRKWPVDFMNKIICGDCLEIAKDIPPNSIDMILTDPPYAKASLECWHKLKFIGEKVLKPSHFLIAYTGLMFLPQVLNTMDGKLTFYWPFAILHSVFKDGSSPLDRASLLMLYNSLRSCSKV